MIMSYPNLLLYSDNPTFRVFAPVIGGIWKVGAKEQKAFKSLADMVREIGKHPFLDQLVIFTHGFRGGIALEDRHSYNLNDEEVTKAFAKVKTQVDHIRFEGCWVGEGAADMGDFGRMLRAIDVSGYTWEHVDGATTITIQRGATAASVESLVRPYWKWLAPFPPESINRLASLARNHDVNMTLRTEWYKYAIEEDIPRAPWEVNGKGQDMVLGPHGYKRRSQAEQRIVQAKDAENSTDPSPPFEYVTVQLHLGGRILDI
jgi:hypothetical protein